MKMKNSLKFYLILTPLLLVGAFFVPQIAGATVLNSQTTTLNPGWNIVSTPKVLLNHEFSVAETSDNFDIYLLDPTSTSGWQTMQGEGQTEFQPLFAYFINNKTGQSQTLTFNYDFSLTPAQRLFQRTLQPGWNAVGIASPSYALPQGSTSADINNPNNILGSIIGSVGQVIDFTSGDTNVDSPAISGTWLSKTATDVNSLNDFRELKAYGVFVTSETNNYIGSQNLSLPVQYTLTYAAGTHGRITGTLLQTVTSGYDGTAVTAVPATGYNFVNWSDGSTANPRTDTNVTANVSVTANFAFGTNVTVSVDPTFTSQTTITGGATNAVIGRFIIHGYGEDVKIGSLQVNPSLTSSNPTFNELENITLYFNGSQVGTQQNWTSGTLTFQLGSQMIAPAGQDSTLEIRADIMGNNNINYTAGTLALTLPAETSNATGQSSQTTLGIPTTDVSTTGLSIQSASLSIIKNSAYADQAIAPNTAAVKIGSYTIQNQSSAEGIRLTSLKIKMVDANGVQLDSNSTPPITNFSALRTSDTTGSGSTPIQPTGLDTLSVNDVLQAGASMTLDVFANTGSSASGSFKTEISVCSIGTVSNVATCTPSADVYLIGQTITLGTGTIATPTLVVSSTTPSQYISSSGSGATNATQAAYNFVSSNGVSTITELKFTITDSASNNSVTNICVGSVCAAPVSGIADLKGLSLAVPNGGGGFYVNAQASYAPVGSGGLTSGTTSNIALSYYKYTSGGTANIKQAPDDFTAISAKQITLVGSSPTVTINSTSNSGLILGAQNKIGQASFSANVTGSIRLNTITFNIGDSGLTTTSPSISSPFIAIGSTQVAGSSCVAGSGISTVTCTLGSGYSSDYSISAGQTQTFNLFATVNGTAIDGATVIISSSLTPTGFIWDDTSTSGASGTGLNGNLIYSFPTASYSIYQ